MSFPKEEGNKNTLNYHIILSTLTAFPYETATTSKKNHKSASLLIHFLGSFVVVFCTSFGHEIKKKLRKKVINLDTQLLQTLYFRHLKIYALWVKPKRDERKENFVLLFLFSNFNSLHSSLQVHVWLHNLQKNWYVF